MEAEGLTYIQAHMLQQMPVLVSVTLVKLSLGFYSIILLCFSFSLLFHRALDSDYVIY